ncbi:hypothetical protein DICVIV_13444 [Dictyocaulus viviparus]|uniref:Uncharacterized protein n=1 Tax=Dictyocaulus viviparus TaxID=29172 RepID=A0A0D8XA06_DICVI|nr:hypothetical protein DICVIV_13444 [Dictyocaulus viviparus]
MGENSKAASRSSNQQQLATAGAAAAAAAAVAEKDEYEDLVPKPNTKMQAVTPSSSAEKGKQSGSKDSKQSKGSKDKKDKPKGGKKNATKPTLTPRARVICYYCSFRAIRSKS